MKLFDVSGPCLKYIGAQMRKLSLANISKVEGTEDGVKLTTNDGKTYKFSLKEEDSSSKEN